MTTRCKFFCKEIVLNQDGQKITLEPVMSGSKENDEFFKYTPFGKLEIGTVNKNIKFEPGKNYFIDISVEQ